MTAAPLILLVDDDEVFRERLARSLRERAYKVLTAPDQDAALAAARSAAIDYAVIDLRMHAGSGLALLGPLRALAPSARLVMLTGYGSIASAVEALRLGADDYLSKPVDADEVIAALTGPRSTKDSTKDPATGSASTPRPAPPASAPSLARAEWEHIQRVLADCSGNVSEAARRLGITRRTLQLKLKKYPPRT